MSNPNSPSRETVSPSSSSALDSSTFYSINDSDLGDLNASAANRSLVSNGAGDTTLTNISQSTLNFLIDEKQQLQQQQQQQQKPSPNEPIRPRSPVPTPRVAQNNPSAPQLGGDAVVDGGVAASKPAVVERQAQPQQQRDSAIVVVDDDDEAIGASIIELSSDDDNNSDNSSKHLSTNPTLTTNSSLDSRSGSLPEDPAPPPPAQLPASTTPITTVTPATTTTTPATTTATTATTAKSATRTIKVDHTLTHPVAPEPPSPFPPLAPIPIYNTLAEFDEHLPETVKLLRGADGARVYVVGTAHFSRESMDDVSLVIRNTRPDVVMVELCASRIHILRHNEQQLLEEASNINLANVRNIVATNGLINGLFYIVLLKMSAKLTQELGMAPGGEFRRALEEAHRLDACILHLGDRPINITLQRALHGLSWWQTLKIVWKLVSSDEKISKEDVEKCKQADMLEELMAEMAGEYPEFRNVFVTERDLYLCHSLEVAASQQDLTGKTVRPVTVVGVVGIGHMAGITQHWGRVDVERIPEITTIPKQSRSSKVVRFAIKCTIVGAIGYGVYRAVGQARWAAIRAW